MNGDQRCQRCDTPLTGQAVGGLCAKCLLGVALQPAGEGIPVSLWPDIRKSLAPSNAADEPTNVAYFGDYELVQEIARGGMGVVYRARQVSLNRAVALKMILAGGFSSPAMVERFQTEAEAAARLEHPNIVPVYEIGTHEGQHYFSMRFVEGGTLTQAIAEKKFIPPRAAELMVKVARAVHHAHQRGILHRDLKPGNILLDAAGEPHIADFGLAKLLEHDSALTRSATVLGTPAYMAPEQAEGQAKEATTAVDIYSLGAILYELLTGRPPFNGASPLDVLVQVREREPVSPQSINPELDRDAAVICLKCLEKDPAARYGSAEALAEELQRWLAGEPIQARQTTLPERAWKWARRKPVVAGLLVAILLVGQAGIIAVLLQTRRANIEAANARAQSQRAENELWKANLSEARALRKAGGSGARVQSSALLHGLLQRRRLSDAQQLQLREEAIAQLALGGLAPPERWVANPTGVIRAWNARLDRYLWSDNGPRVELREFPSEKALAVFVGPSPANYYTLTFSPDEQWVSARFNNGEMRVWNVASQAELLSPTGVEHASFSPDSQTLLTLTAQGLALHPLVKNGTARSLQPGRRARQAVYSPDGKFVLVLLSDPRQQVEIWEAESGLVRATFIMDFPPSQAAWNADSTRLALGGDRGRLEWRTLGTNGDGTLLVGEPVPLFGHLGAIQTIQFSPDGFTLLTYAWDVSSILWDLTAGFPLLRELQPIAGFDASGQRALVTHARSNGVARILPPTGYRTVAFAGRPREAHAARVSPDGRLGVAVYDSTVTRVEGDCILWDFAHDREVARFKGIDAVFSADSETLFTFERYGANRIRRYDVSAENLAQRSPGWDEGRVFYKGQGDEGVTTGELAPDGRTLIVAATTAVLFLDTRGQARPRSLPKPAHAAVASSDGNWVATSISGQPAALRAMESGTNVFRALNAGRIRFSPDSRWMATVDATGVQMRELRFPSFVAHDTNHCSEPANPPLAFAPDSRTFAVVFNSTHVRLHDTATGRELATLSPPRLAAIRGGRALNFSPDGQWLLAAKHDGEVVAWHLPTLRAELAKLGLDWEDG